MTIRYSKRVSNKHASNKRSSNKRAYKKGRTVRKLRSTIRRKFQVGGDAHGNGLFLMAIMLPLIAAIGGDKLMKFLNIVMIITGQKSLQSGGFFGISSFEDMKAKASAGLGDLQVLGKSIGEKTTSKLNEIRGTPTGAPAAPTSGTAAPANVPPGKLKETLINMLTDLKKDIDSEPNPNPNEPNPNKGASVCLGNLIKRLKLPIKASEPKKEGEPKKEVGIDLDNPNVPNEPLPDPPGNITDTIKKSIIVEYNKLKDDQTLTLIDKIKQGSILALGGVQQTINLKIDMLLKYIKLKYKFTDADMNCFKILKDTLIGNLTRKLDNAINTVKENPAAKGALAALGSARSSIFGMADAAKGRFSSFFGNGNNPAPTPAALAPDQAPAPVVKKKKKVLPQPQPAAQPAAQPPPAAQPEFKPTQVAWSGSAADWQANQDKAAAARKAAAKAAEAPVQLGIVGTPAIMSQRPAPAPAPAPKSNNNTTGIAGFIGNFRKATGMDK